MRREKEYGLYAILFSNKTVKVGKSTDIERRVNEHTHNALCLGISVVEIFCVEKPKSINEDDLIVFCCGIGKRRIGEWFYDISFPIVKKYLIADDDKMTGSMFFPVRNYYKRVAQAGFHFR